MTGLVLTTKHMKAPTEDKSNLAIGICMESGCHTSSLHIEGISEIISFYYSRIFTEIGTFLFPFFSTVISTFPFPFSESMDEISPSFVITLVSSVKYKSISLSSDVLTHFDSTLIFQLFFLVGGLLPTVICLKT